MNKFQYFLIFVLYRFVLYICISFFGISIYLDLISFKIISGIASIIMFIIYDDFIANKKYD